MFATDFIYNGQRASDLGWMICNFDGNEETASGGNIEFIVKKAPANDVYSYYGSHITDVLEWKFSIMKSPCLTYEDDIAKVTQYDESAVARWLLSTNGYKWLQFDQDGYRDICYMVKWQMTPHQINGRTVGFDLTATSNCGYGFSEEKIKTQTIKHDANDAENDVSINLYINNDIKEYVLPEIRLTSTSGNFYLSNLNDKIQNKDVNRQTEFYIDGNIDVTLDCMNDIVLGLNSTDEFNWFFPRLVNGYNTITTNSTDGVTITIKYRENRRVIV